MILVIPSLDIKQGVCCNKIIGEEGTSSLYNEIKNNPCELLRLWRRENAKSLHINDWDSFRETDKEKNINGIIYLTESIDIPLSLYFDINDVDICNVLLKGGVYRLILGPMFLQEMQEIKELVSFYTSSRICAYMDADDRFAYFDDYNIKIPINEYMKIIKATGTNRILYKNRHWDYNLNEFDIEQIKKLAIDNKIRITVNGAVNNSETLWKINELCRFGVDSIMLNEALYQNKFPCQKIWRMIEAELEPDLISYSMFKK
jgi:phosphoribosylformimino-5-aminoimidazole carboxamide ribotide isomerase